MGGMDVGGDFHRVLIDDDGGVLGQEADTDIVLQEAVHAVHGAAVAAARDVEAVAIHEEGVAVQLHGVAGGLDLVGVAVGDADDDLIVGGLLGDAEACGGLFDVLDQLVCGVTNAIRAPLLHHEGVVLNVHAADGQLVEEDAVVGLGFGGDFLGSLLGSGGSLGVGRLGGLGGGLLGGGVGGGRGILGGGVGGGIAAVAGGQKSHGQKQDTGDHAQQNFLVHGTVSFRGGNRHDTIISRSTFPVKW